MQFLQLHLQQHLCCIPQASVDLCNDPAWTAFWILQDCGSCTSNADSSASTDCSNGQTLLLARWGYLGEVGLQGGVGCSQVPQAGSRHSTHLCTAAVQHGHQLLCHPCLYITANSALCCLHAPCYIRHIKIVCVTHNTCSHCCFAVTTSRCLPSLLGTSACIKFTKASNKFRRA